jgi:transcription-repair coupling factor (superfamily II helicase)
LTDWKKLNPNDAARECLVLQFAGDSRLLVPAEEAGRIWRYGSGEASAVDRDRLTGEAWLRLWAEVAREISAPLTD